MVIGLADSEDGEINDVFAPAFCYAAKKITNFAISSGGNK